MSCISTLTPCNDSLSGDLNTVKLKTELLFIRKASSLHAMLIRRSNAEVAAMLYEMLSFVGREGRIMVQCKQHTVLLRCYAK